MKDLTDLSTTELERELATRKAKADAAAVPQPLAEADFTPVRDLCVRYIETLAKGEYVDEDTDHWAFEVAMESVFGKDVWKWVNPKLR